MSKNSTPLVSVIVPNYNYSHFLKQRLDSILNQTFQDFELILLDDCSTDDSRELLEKYRDNDKVSHIVINEKNSGSAFMQWKKGFALARGEYIWIAESDDYSDLTFLEKLVTQLEQNPQASLAYCYSHLVDENGTDIPDDWDRRDGNDQEIKIMNGRDFDRNWMLYNCNIFNASSVVFRRSVLDHINDKYLEYKYCGDWHFWNMMCLTGDIIVYGRRLNYFRQHRQKVTSASEYYGYNFTEGMHVIGDLMKVLKLNVIQRKIVIGFFYRRLLRTRQLKDEQTREEILTRAKKYFKTGLYAIYLYRRDRRLNFSSLDIRKNRAAN